MKHHELINTFRARLSGGNKNKILVIMDDVWQVFDMNDIGLSPFPHQVVDLKVLLTLQDTNICTTVGVEVNSILYVKGLEEQESQGFFRQLLEFFDDGDHDLRLVGEYIVRRCCGLLIAIRRIACTFKGKSKDVWDDALSRLKHHDIDEIVHQVFKMSFYNLKDDTISILLLCGLFPEDFNIPMEDLVPYAWGLKLFSKVYTISEARDGLDTCIDQLIHTNLLIESLSVGCAKMHDLVRAFVLSMFSKVEHASIVKHDNISLWPRKKIPVSLDDCVLENWSNLKSFI